MDIMSIASMSMGMSQVSLQSQVSVAVLKKTMDSQQNAMNTLIQGMADAGRVPSFGHDLDVLV